MEPLPNPIYTKEMVDLLMRVKKHLHSHQQVSIRLSDPALFDKLVKMHSRDDPLLESMLQYLMALAGPDWSQRYASTRAGGGGQGAVQDSKPGGKGLFRLRETFFAERSEVRSQPPPPPDPVVTVAEAGERKPVRYYRGQPVYDD
ncbi:MAG TPA: hypothetical protein VIK82_08875 [Porticoccaceae bacterium]